jgi:hypothetical protein
MNSILKIKMVAFLGVISSIFFSCKTETVIADFSINATQIAEGKPLQLNNNSQNGITYVWSVTPGNWSSHDKSPTIQFDEAGNYLIKLITYNRKHSSVKQMSVDVIPDTVWRLTHNDIKTWYVSSLVYAGTEMLVAECQKDDEFTMVKASPIDTFSFTEGLQTCPSGTYVFTIPTSGAWRFNKVKNSLEFALTAFGSPYNFSFVTSNLTKDSFEGIDAANDVLIKLRSTK